MKNRSHCDKLPVSIVWEH